MTTVHSAWFQQGFFVLGNEGLMPAVRDELERKLNLRRGSLHISSFPVAANWRHTYWWRESHTEYAEAQFFAQIAKEYPVLSVGLAIEKGFETTQATTIPEKTMNRDTWDWPRLVDYIDAVLAIDVPSAAASLQAPLNLRIRTKSVQDGEEEGWQARAFSFIENTWFERHVGRANAGVITEYVRELDEQKSSWVIVHFAEDIAAADAEGLSPSQLATRLASFDTMRRRLRGSLTGTAV